MRRLLYGLLFVIWLITFVGSTISSPLVQALSKTPDWLGVSTPTVTKLQNLANTDYQFANPLDCFYPDGTLANYDAEWRNCRFKTPFGYVYYKRLFLPGEAYDSLGHIVNFTSGGKLVPSGSDDYMFELIYGTEQTVNSYGIPYDFQATYLNVYTHPKWENFVDGGVNEDGVPSYNYVGQPDYKIHYASGNPVDIAWESVAVSANGHWLTALNSDYDVLLIDTTDFSARIVGDDLTYQYAEGTPLYSLAVSDDGRFVASSFPDPNSLGFKVYDTMSCNDSHPVQESVDNGRLVASFPCAYKNVWLGTIRGIQHGKGWKDLLSDAPSLFNPRFQGNNTIEFSAVEGWHTATPQAARFRVTIGGGGQVITDWGSTDFVQPVVSEEPVNGGEEKIRLLALGDSYISGEGAYSYVNGTDTSNNKCHTSAVSYPFLLGAKYADGGYHSVACSGATSVDILNESMRYMGQVKDELLWSQRETDNILSNYQPGYANQLRFIASDNPDVVLLSIGGNDVHFADIVTLCVLSGANSPCFSTRGERESLLRYVYTRHDDLVQTYSKILADHPKRRLYVVGYPQVINPTGSCGMNVRFDDQERKFGSQLIDRINATIQNAAKASGAYYVDISHSLDGHRLCDATDDGVNGLTAGNDKLILGNESYHPTALGHSRIAATVASKTDNLKTPMPPATNAEELTANPDDPFLTDTGAVLPFVRRLVFTTITPVPYAAVTYRMRAKLDAKIANIPPDQNYEIVLYSNHVKVAEGKVTHEGMIDTTFTVPRLEYGAHTLHVFTTDAEGEPLDLAQVVYVGVNQDDLDGDGVSNDQDNQPFVNDTGTVVGEIPEFIPAPETPKAELLPGDAKIAAIPTEKNTIPLAAVQGVVVQQSASVGAKPSALQSSGEGVVLAATITRMTEPKKIELAMATKAPGVSQTFLAGVTIGLALLGMSTLALLTWHRHKR